MNNVILKTPRNVLVSAEGEYSLYRVRNYNRWADGHKLRCPPAVYPMFDRPLAGASTTRTPMSRYGWESCLRELNGERFDVAVHNRLVMFNGADSWSEGNDKMETILLACAWVYAKPSGTWGWHQIWTMNYEAGPPPGLNNYKNNPILIQKLTMMCWAGGGLLARQLYYPIVSRYACFLESEYLEPWSANMQTPDPPMGAALLVDSQLQEIMDYEREYYDWRDWE